MTDLSLIHTRTKICGLTNLDDVRAAVAFGADAIGMVFYEKSPRNISAKKAKELARAAGPFVTTVGLFVNPTAEFVSEVINEVPLQLLQFHGDEPADFCEQFSVPYIKALRVKPIFESSDAELPALEIDAIQQQIIQDIEKFSSAQGILLDTFSKKGRGGTGEMFNWECVPSSCNKPIILAGGLGPDNVADAIAQTKPYAVDVSSGVESAPGKKDQQLVKKFITAVSKTRK